MRARSILLPLASILTALCVLGCPLLKKKGGDDPGTEDAATVAAAGLGAKNEADVLRYARETALPNEPAVIGADGTKARNFPGNGPEVATLAKGTSVLKIAQYFATGTLIMFEDPSGDGSKLMGWVTPTAFDTAAPKPVKPIVPPNVVRVVDAGATAPKDAGAAPVKDAGAPTATKDAGTTPVAVVDAGKGASADPLPPQPEKGKVAVAPDAKGRCPEGWAIAPDMCRRKCAADSECPRNTKCGQKGLHKVCSSDH